MQVPKLESLKALESQPVQKHQLLTEEENVKKLFFQDILQLQFQKLKEQVL